MAGRIPSNDLRFVVTAILVQKETGGNLTEILDRTTEVIRERVRIEGEVRVRTAQGRLTGWILSLLPVILLFLMTLVNPDYSHVLLHDPIGQHLLYLGVGLITVGHLHHSQDCRYTGVTVTLFFYLAFGSTLFCGAALLFSATSRERSRTSKRIRQVTAGALYVDPRTARKKRAAEIFERTIRGLRTRIGLAEDERLRQRFLSTGPKGSGKIELYFAVRMLGPVLAIVVGSFIPSNTFFWITVLAGAAYLIPDFCLERAIKARRERIRRSIPDAVDLLVICVDAGLGLDQAMLRVGQELSISHPEINQEFMQINREQRAGKPRMEAWQSMADRTKVPDIAAFTSMLVQTEKFGTPIARALSTFADGIRQKRRLRAEEMAAKTTVKMIFPLVLFIFPSMFIVLLAPAVLSIARGLSGLSH